MTGLPAKYFAIGPYSAQRIGPNEWWGVANKNGMNVLTFGNGRVFTNEAEAKKLADEWNTGKVFVYPLDPYKPPVTKRWTDEQMGKYIRSQRFINGRWIAPIEETME